MAKEICKTCGGRGEIFVHLDVKPLFMFMFPIKRKYRKCELCNGTGMIEPKKKE